jgi:hypothetical protein
MAIPNRRGQSAGPVSESVRGDDYTPFSQTSFLNPFGLTLRQTITSSGSVTIPAGIDWVYVVMTGGGRGVFFGYGGGAGEISWGWTLAQNTCIIGAGGPGSNTGAGYTRYGHIIARGAPTNTATANYYGIPGGLNFGDGNPQNGGIGSNAGGGGGAASGTAQGGNGGSGISGGAGGQGAATTGTSTGGNGGSGLAGGGGGQGTGTTTGTRTGGNGGNGLGIDGTIYTGGSGASQTNATGGGGGGAGIAGNGSNASGGTGGNGGLGGGGGGSGSGTSSVGGAGILYIFY